MARILLRKKISEDILKGEFYDFLKTMPRHMLFKTLRKTTFDLDLMYQAIISKFCTLESYDSEEYLLPTTLQNIMEQFLIDFFKCKKWEQIYHITKTLYNINQFMNQESFSIFDYLYIRKFVSKLVSKLLYNKVIAKIKQFKLSPKVIKRAIQEYIAFYINEFERSIKKVTESSRLLWILNASVMKLIQIYHIDLLSVEDNLIEFNEIPLLTTSSKIVGITSVNYLERMLNYWKEANNIEYQKVEMREFAKEGNLYKIQDKDFGYANSYFDPIKNMFKEIYYPNKIAPLIVVVNNILVLIAPAMSST